MTANDFYEKADQNGIHLVCNCTEITQRTWFRLMKHSVKANKRKVESLIKKHAPNFYKNMAMEFYNPYTPKKTKTHIIYIHSSIEYFFKINDNSRN